MSHNSSDEKQQAHLLIDRLAPVQVSAVLPLLQFMLLDPLSRSLVTAPVEQEPVSPGEAAALDEAHASLDGGQSISHEDILREFGLSPR